MIFPIKYQNNKDNYKQMYKNKYTWLSSNMCSHEINEYLDVYIYNAHHKYKYDALLIYINTMIKYINMFYYYKGPLYILTPTYSSIIDWVIATTKHTKKAIY